MHGYRGFDTRNNLHYTTNGDIVFHAAGAAIVYNSETKTQSFYLEHTDDIICLASNHNPKFKVHIYSKFLYIYIVLFMCVIFILFISC